MPPGSISVAWYGIIVKSDLKRKACLRRGKLKAPWFHPECQAEQAVTWSHEGCGSSLITAVVHILDLHFIGILVR